MDERATLEQLRAACAEPLDHPGADERRQMSQQVVDFALAEIAELGNRPVGRTASRAAMEALLHEPLPEHGRDCGRVLDEFRDKVLPHAMRVNHPRFLAFVPAAPSFASLMGDWLCDAVNLFAGVWLEAPGPAQVELLVLDWFRRILGYPDEASGVLTGGGSEALLTALVTARERLRPEQRSLAVLYVSDQRHWSVDRGAHVAGFATNQVRALATGPDLRMDLAALRQAIDDDARGGRVPWLVVANAGTTNTGAVDPLDELADLCGDMGLWLHADAAYGWAAALTAEGRRLLRGIDRADSFSLDPHKWFAQTYDVGCLLVRSRDALEATFTTRPEYLQDVLPGADEVNFADRGIALTRRFRALKIWFSVKVLGIGWFRQLVAHGCNLAAYAEGLLRQTAGFEVLSDRQLSVICFRYAPPGWSGAALADLNRAICAEAIATGRVFLVTTRLGQVAAMRACFVNWRTTADDVDEVVRLLADIGRRLAVRKGNLT